jgi:hypothetical protein
MQEVTRRERSRITKTNYQPFMLESEVFDELAFMWHMGSGFRCTTSTPPFVELRATSLTRAMMSRRPFLVLGLLPTELSGTEYFSS